VRSAAKNSADNLFSAGRDQFKTTMLAYRRDPIQDENATPGLLANFNNQSKQHTYET